MLNILTLLANKFPYLLTFFVSLTFLFYLKQKKIVNNRQWLVFFSLFLFWSANILIRAYRKSYALNGILAGGLNLGVINAAEIAAAYGLSSIFSRYAVFYLSNKLKTRKWFISAVLSILFLSNIFVLFLPNYYTLYINSLSLGINASSLMLFNLLFIENESISEEKTAEENNIFEIIKGISLLSIAPLMSEFSMSIFQANFTLKGSENYPSLWILSSIMVIISLLILPFVKENTIVSKNNMSFCYFRKMIKNLSVWLFGILGILLSFVKFSTTGSNIITYFQADEISMHSYGIAYSDFLFSLAQLISGLLMGYIFVKRFGFIKSLKLSIILGFIYLITLLLTFNPNILFLSQLLAGFSYGLSYNLLLAWALTGTSTELRDMNCAIYQTFFALGIFLGDKIYAYVFTYLRYSGLNNFYVYKYVFLLALIISVFSYIIIVIQDKLRINTLLK